MAWEGWRQGEQKGGEAERSRGCSSKDPVFMQMLLSTKRKKGRAARQSWQTRAMVGSPCCSPETQGWGNTSGVLQGQAHSMLALM